MKNRAKKKQADELSGDDGTFFRQCRIFFFFRQIQEIGPGLLHLNFSAISQGVHETTAIKKRRKGIVLKDQGESLAKQHQLQCVSK